MLTEFCQSQMATLSITTIPVQLMVIQPNPQEDLMIFNFLCPGHHSVMSRYSMFTLAVGFSLGFSLAYMILSASSLGGRREMFLGPPIHGEQDPHSHNHKVSVRVTSRHLSQTSQMVETSVSSDPRQII